MGGVKTGQRLRQIYAGTSLPRKRNLANEATCDWVSDTPYLVPKGTGGGLTTPAGDDRRPPAFFVRHLGLTVFCLCRFVRYLQQPAIPGSWVCQGGSSKPLGPILEAKLEPSWLQNRSKRGSTAPQRAVPKQNRGGQQHHKEQFPNKTYLRPASMTTLENRDGVRIRPK